MNQNDGDKIDTRKKIHKSVFRRVAGGRGKKNRLEKCVRVHGTFVACSEKNTLLFTIIIIIICSFLQNDIVSYDCNMYCLRNGANRVLHFIRVIYRVFEITTLYLLKFQTHCEYLLCKLLYFYSIQNIFFLSKYYSRNDLEVFIIKSKYKKKKKKINCFQTSTIGTVGIIFWTYYIQSNDEQRKNLSLALLVLSR